MAIAHVQTAGDAPGSVANDTLAYGSNVTAGNFLAACVRCASGGVPISVSDSLNGAWTSAGLHTQTNDSNAVIQWFYFPNTAGGACTVTVTLSGTVILRYVITEFSGVATTSPQDGSKVSAEGVGTALASGTLTPSANGALLLCGGFSSTVNTYTAGTDFTIPTNGAVPPDPANQRLAIEYFIQPTAASHDGTFSVTDTVNWAAILVAFKEPGGAAAPVNVAPIIQNYRNMRLM